MILVLKVTEAIFGSRLTPVHRGRGGSVSLEGNILAQISGPLKFFTALDYTALNKHMPRGYKLPVSQSMATSHQCKHMPLGYL